jgi:peptidoglycan/xylan/chitin deacetylase (PgdA/CDA1 family)
LKPSAFLTTSWDDGNPCDLRIAEMLAKHGIPGTFYVPRQAETGTMNLAQLRELSRGFEIGAHTLGHVVLTDAPAEQAWQEIAGSKSWIEDQTGAACSMFCPPRGRYRRDHLRMVREAGFIGLRSVELASLHYPRRGEGLLIMPTSVQAFPHRRGAYLRNITKRGALRNFWLYVLNARAADWVAMARNLLGRVAARGGVFHLWGHSWEIRQEGQWQRLDDVLRLMACYAPPVLRLENGEICAAVAATGRVRVT